MMSRAEVESRVVTSIFMVGIGAVAAVAIWLIYKICLAFLT